MEIRVLGQFDLVDGRVSVRTGGTKQRAVLAMLALQANAIVSADALIDGLWGPVPPPSAVNIVQAYISRLRKIFAGALPAEPGMAICEPPAGLPARAEFRCHRRPQV